MLRCLVEPALKILRQPAPPDYNVFYASELVANVERLLIEMFSGNETIVPTKYWRRLGIMDGIYEGSFPTFDKELFDLDAKDMDLDGWPRDEEGTLMFIQEPALRYHFSNQVVSLQRSLLERCVRKESITTMTASDVLDQGRTVIAKAYMEWKTAVVNTMSLDIELAIASSTGDEPMYRDELRRDLTRASTLIQDDGTILSKK